MPAIPADERSDRTGLIDGPLPEPPPYVEPEEIEPEEEGLEGDADSSKPSPFEEYSFDDSVFEATGAPLSFPSEEFKEQPSLPEHKFIEHKFAEQETSEDGPTQEEPSESDPFLTTAAHASPFTIEGPPDDPFTIAEKSEDASATEENISPFSVTPQPFGAKEFTHEPCELNDPFAVESDESATNEATPFSGDDFPSSDEASPFSEGLSPFTPVPKAESSPEDDKKEEDEKTLSQQIADAKEQHQASPFDPSQSELLTEPEKSSKLPLFAAALGILTIIGACLFFFTDIFTGPRNQAIEIPPLIEFPARGIPLPQTDIRVTEAEEVAKKFLQAKNRDEVAKVIQPVEPSLLVDFWEPITAPTIERLFQGRILENDRVEVDFLINDIKGKERILPLVKTGEGPFQVDWKNFAECEDATLLGLAQGTLILDSGEELNEGAIRSFVQDGKELKGDMLGNFQGFKLHNFTEEVVALGVVRKDSHAFTVLSDAIASTELKHLGKPAIRAVLRVKLIEEEDVRTKRPARLEILKVLSIDGKEHPEDEIIQEKLPDVSNQGGENAKATNESAPEEEEAPAAEEPASDELPPVPADTDPLSKNTDDSLIFRVTAN